MEDPHYTYDVFISYSHHDRAWVHEWLLPRLEADGLSVCIDFRDFDVGVPSVVNMERAIDNSHHTLLVLTPAWVASEWTEFEALLIQTADPAGRRRRLLPLLLQPCQPPRRIAMLTYADFTQQEQRSTQLERVLAAVRGELHLSEIGPPLGRLILGPEKPPFVMPFMRNPAFVGREEDMNRLHAALMGDAPVGIRSGVTVPTGLMGMGGIGKTQLAVEYAHRYRDAYPGGVFWIDAAKPLDQGFAQLGLDLPSAVPDHSQDEQIRAVFGYLRSHPDSLLVLDNLGDPANLNRPIGADLVPAALPCRVLFTTRRRDLGLFQAIEVTVLPVEPALELLLRDPRHQAILDPAHPEHGKAQTICATLGYLPLALELAAAYLGEYAGEVTLEGYLERLRTEGRLETVDDTHLRTEDLPTRHPAAVTATLQTQWSRLDNEDARLLFRAAGQFPEAETIPILQLGLLTGIETEAAPGHPAPLTRALKKLRAVSLIEDLTGNRLRLHPLVHEFAAQQTPVHERKSFRVELANNLVNSLKDPVHRNERAIVAGECLLALGWSDLPAKTRTPVLNTLRWLMCSEQMPDPDRRTAASLLTRLRWIDDAQGISPNEILICMRLIGRYLDSPADRLYVVQSISSVLDAEAIDLSDRQRAQLLVYLAGMLGRLYELGEFTRNSKEAEQLLNEADRYYEEATQLISELIGSEDSRPEDQKLLAQVNLGAASIAKFRVQTLTTPGGQEEALRGAVNLLTKATEAAQAYGQDVILETSIYGELSYIYALLQNWEEAEKSYQTALRTLDGVGDPEARVRYRAQVLETASVVHLTKGQSLPDSSQALAEYGTAYRLAQEEIKILTEFFGESEDLGLVFAHITSGDCLQAMGKLPNCDEPWPLTKDARAHWQTARDMASRLGISNMAQEASERLAEYCQNGDT